MPSAMTKCFVGMSSLNGTAESGQGVMTLDKVRDSKSTFKVTKGPPRKRRKSAVPSPKASKATSESGDDKVEVDAPVLERFRIMERLGKGAYGIVWEAVEIKTNKKVALKKIFDAFRNNMDAQRTYREIFFLLKFGNHPNIISVTGGHRARNDQDFYICFPLLATDLHKLVKSAPEKLGDVQIRTIFYQICKAVLYLHSANVLHRDLKPANILLDKALNVKLGDFGLARSMTSVDWGKGDCHPEMTDYIATRWYRPPEVLLSCRKYSKAIDIWGLACILAEMVNRKALFPAANTIEQIEMVIGAIEHPTREELERLTTSTSIQSVVLAAMMNRKPTLAELLKNYEPIMLDLMRKILIFSPEKRLTIEEVLDHPFLMRHRQVWEEIRCNHPITPEIDDSVRFPIDTYRNYLYGMLERGEICAPSELPKTSSVFSDPGLNSFLERHRSQSAITLPLNLIDQNLKGGSGDAWGELNEVLIDSNTDLQHRELPQKETSPVSKTSPTQFLSSLFNKKFKLLSWEKSVRPNTTAPTVSESSVKLSLEEAPPPPYSRPPIAASQFSTLQQKLYSKRKLYTAQESQSRDKVAVEPPRNAGKRPDFCAAELEETFREVQKKLDAISFENDPEEIDVEKGECAESLNSKTEDVFRTPSTTGFRSITQAILSLSKYPKKTTAVVVPERPMTQQFRPSTSIDLTFIDETPPPSRGRKPSTAISINKHLDVDMRPQTHCVELELSNQRPGSGYHNADRPPIKPRGRQSRTQLGSIPVSFTPDTGSDLSAPLGMTLKKPTNRTGQSQISSKFLKSNAEKEREKMKHSAYFPVIEFNTPPQSHVQASNRGSRTQNEATMKFSREVQRCRIAAAASKIDESPPVLPGVIRYEPLRTRRRSKSRQARPITQPSPTEKLSLRFPPKIDQRPTVFEASNVRPANYATISSKDLNDLRATFSHVGRY